MERIPLFVINIGVSCENQRSYYEIKIISKSNATAKWLKNIINIDDINQDIKIPKNINREIF